MAAWKDGMSTNEARFNDAYAVLVSECKVIEDYVRREGIRTVLEFGPGRSTLMFAAAGCEVWTAECNECWFNHYRQLFADESAIQIVRFENVPLIQIPELEGKRFDLAFVDSPAGHEFPPGMSSRLNSCEFAALYTDRLLLHDAERAGEQATIAKVQNAGWRIDSTWERARCVLLRR